MGELLTDKQVAFHYGLSVHSLRSARSNKPNLRMPPYVRIGGRVYYTREAVLAFLRDAGIVAVGPGGIAPKPAP